MEEIRFQDRAEIEVATGLARMAQAGSDLAHECNKLCIQGATSRDQLYTIHTHVNLLVENGIYADVWTPDAWNPEKSTLIIRSIAEMASLILALTMQVLNDRQFPVLKGTNPIGQLEQYRDRIRTAFIKS